MPVPGARTIYTTLPSMVASAALARPCAEKYRGPTACEAARVVCAAMSPGNGEGRLVACPPLCPLSSFRLPPARYCCLLPGRECIAGWVRKVSETMRKGCRNAADCNGHHSTRQGNRETVARSRGAVAVQRISPMLTDDIRVRRGRNPLRTEFAGEGESTEESYGFAATAARNNSHYTYLWSRLRTSAHARSAVNTATAAPASRRRARVRATPASTS